MSLPRTVSTNAGLGPKFIFGRLNPNFRASAGGDDTATEQLLADLTARLQQRLGHKPTPRQLQDAFRRHLLANVRGRLLQALTEKNGGKPPTPDDFRAAMDQWRSRNLVGEMSAVNKALGTKGTGYPGGKVNPPRRAGWQQRLESTLAAAAKVYATSQATVQKADAPNLRLRAVADRTAARVQRRIAAFLEEQRIEIAKRLEARGDAIARKPADTSPWWDAARWDAALEKLLLPVAESLADLAADRVSAALEPTGKAGLDELAGKNALDRLLRRVGVRIKGINETTRQEIATLVADGVKEGVSMAELGERIRASTAFSDNRAEMIARTETGTALNQAQIESYREYRVDKVRVFDGDGDQVCADANGAVWTLDEAATDPLGHPSCTRDFAPLIGGN